MADTPTFDKVRETVGHGLVYGLGGSAATLVGTILVPVYTNYLSSEEYGVLALINIMALLAMMTFNLSLPSGLFRSYFDSDDEDYRKTVVGTATVILFLMSAILVLTSFVASDFFSMFLFDTPDYGRHIRLIMIASSFTILSSVPVQVLRARKLSKRFTVLNIFSILIQLLAVIYFVVFLGQGVWGVIVGRFCGEVLTALLYYGSSLRLLSFRFSLVEARKQLAFSIPLIFSSISSFILTWIDRYFLAVFSTLSTVGVYSLGYRIGMVLNSFLTQPLNMAWGPMMYSVMRQENARKYYSKMLTYVVFYSLVLTLPISLLSKEVLELISKREFWDAYKVVPIICLAYVMQAATQTINVGIGINRKSKLVTTYVTVGAIVNVILNYFLIPVYGMMAAAYTTLFSYIIMLGMSYKFNQKLYPIIYEWGRILRLFFVAVFLMVLGFYFEIDSILLSAAYKTMLILSFPTILFLTNFFDKEEKKRMREIYSQSRKSLGKKSM